MATPKRRCEKAGSCGRISLAATMSPVPPPSTMIVIDCILPPLGTFQSLPRSRSTAPATTATTASISSTEVIRPVENRSVPRAHSSGTRSARSTCETWTWPECLVNGHPDQRFLNTLSASVDGVDANALLVDIEGQVAASAGAGPPRGGPDPFLNRERISHHHRGAGVAGFVGFLPGTPGHQGLLSR
jgi:hypothetical protein